MKSPRYHSNGKQVYVLHVCVPMCNCNSEFHPIIIYCVKQKLELELELKYKGIAKCNTL